MAKTECKICGVECDGKLIVRDANILEPIIVCPECLNDWGNHNYNNLTEKIEKNERYNQDKG